MKTLFRLFFVCIAFSFSNLTYAANSTANFTPTQQQQIQKIVHDYLLKNPQILLETLGKLQEQTDKKNQAKMQNVLKEYANSLISAPNSPVFGNTNGSITLVEFFDYQCPYCKKIGDILSKLTAANPNLRIVMKEWPIFGGASEFAARAALAAQAQGKYLQLHDALMATKGHLTNDEVLAAAKSVGLDMKKLQADMSSKSVMDELKNNAVLAHALELIGTPAFIISKTNSTPQSKVVFIPGAADIDALQNGVKSVG